MPNPFDRLEDNPVWRELQRQETSSDFVNLTDLWRAAGRPYLSPRRWWKRLPKTWNGQPETWNVRPIAGRADAPVWAFWIEARLYAQAIDPQIKEACFEEMCQIAEKAPARFMLAVPDELKGFAACFVNLDDAAAITAEVARRTEPLGVDAQTIEVAKVQRALTEVAKVQRTLR
jgi:hypothetical protein